MIPYRVSRFELELQDKPVNLDDLTVLYDKTAFKLEKLANKTYEKDELVVMDVTIEMNLDLGLIQREGYDAFDVLSDIGGIQSIVITTFSALLGFWNYRHFDNYMASKLYKFQARSKRSDNDEIINKFKDDIDKYTQKATHVNVDKKQSPTIVARNCYTQEVKDLEKHQ